MKELDDRALQGTELPQRLRSARKARGMTQMDAAQQLGLSRTTIVAIEKGERSLRPQELVDLAATYCVSVNELLRPIPVSPAFNARFRTPPSEDIHAPAYQATIAQLQSLADDYVYLEQMANAPLVRHYPPEANMAGHPPEHAGEILALRERNRLGLGDSVVTELRNLLESDVGIRVFSMDLPSSVSGLFVYSDIHGGCIAFNAAHPVGRQRWTLAHEYAHFLAHRHQPELTGTDGYQRVPAHERLADSFAMNFLMPEAGLKWRFHNVVVERSEGMTPADLLNLADRFQVSFEAMGRRLESLGMLRPFAVDRLLADGFRVAEARKILGRPAINSDKQLFADRYCHLALQAWSNENLSEGQLSRLLRIDRTEARKLASAYLDDPRKLKDDHHQLLMSDVASLDTVERATESPPCDSD